MEEIKITEENYEAYQEFNRLNSHIGIPLASKRENTWWNALMITSTIVPLCIVGSLSIIFPNMDFIYMFGLSILTIVDIGINAFITDRIIRKMNMKTFKKEYPDFDITVDAKEVEKALKRYKELSKIPKNIEEEKQEHLSNLSSSVKEMTTEEKVAFLNQEREFWEQVAIQEKYKNVEEKENNRQKRI